MDITSINHVISFLGTNDAVRRGPVSATENRHTSERGHSLVDRRDEPAFVTQFSEEALDRANGLSHETDHPGEPNNHAGQEDSDQSGLSREEQAEVRKLAQRDREVRQHEQAHQAAAGKLASGGPSFSYTRGPDGQQYAVGGEVQIDVSPVAGDPEATIQKMRQVRSAARAPAHPSSADLKVAAAASQTEASARAELQSKKAEEDAGRHGYGRAYTSNNHAVERSGKLFDLLA